MDKGTPDRLPEGQTEKRWSDYVELSRYFSSITVKRCQSTPCMSLTRTTSPSPPPSLSPALTAAMPASPNLSLSWQLACNPVDADQRQVYSAQRQQGAGFLHCKGCRQADMISLNCGEGMKRKKRRQRSVRTNPQQARCSNEMPKIVVVDATMLRAYWNQRQGDADIGDKSHEKNEKSDNNDKNRQPKRTILKIKNPYAAVPLCQRPTRILGSRPSTDHHHQQQQEQEHHGSQHQNPQQYGRRRISEPLQHLTRLAQEQYVLSPKYAVPIEPMYNNLKKGTRYCGNFYYK
ncbi:uncharacterized protein [Drosophila virilis]|uniref:uncharacterized protein n=1 Tax=Drosophila virilis TaxID=7244 RepID=UPI00017D5DE4